MFWLKTSINTGHITDTHTAAPVLDLYTCYVQTPTHKAHVYIVAVYGLSRRLKLIRDIAIQSHGKAIKSTRNKQLCINLFKL